MSESTRSLDAILREFRDDLLRWNRSINLVSRQDSAHRLDSLIRQCREAFGVLMGSGLISRETGKEPLLYHDLGSGSGLPGLVWHAMLADSGLNPVSTLVEPRTKRAWFLARQARIQGLKPFRVEANRWDEEPPEPEPGILPIPRSPRGAVISLKALHLDDESVLEGMARRLTGFFNPAGGPMPLLIVRFYPPGQALDHALEQRLKPIPRGNRAEWGGICFRCQGCEVLAPAGPAPSSSLILARYLVSVS